MLKRSFLTTIRVLRQLRHDPRTIALLLILPSVLLVVLYYVFSGKAQVFHTIAPMLLGIFPFIIMFLVTSVATLRERVTGTLERLATLPLQAHEFILGYTLAFGFMAFLQASIATFITIEWLNVPVDGGSWRLLIIAVLSGLIGESLGLFVSAFATTEFQAVQFMPALVFPQLLTCGLFVERSSMAKGLQWFANIMPLTYVTDAAKHVATETSWSHDLKVDILVIALYALGILILSSLTLKQRK